MALHVCTSKDAGRAGGGCRGTRCRHQFGLSGPAVMATHIPFAGGAERRQPLPRDPRSPWWREGSTSAPVRGSQHPDNRPTTSRQNSPCLCQEQSTHNSTSRPHPLHPVSPHLSGGRCQSCCWGSPHRSSWSVPCHPAAFVSARRLIGGAERQPPWARSPPGAVQPGAAWHFQRLAANKVPLTAPIYLAGAARVLMRWQGDAVQRWALREGPEHTGAEGVQW